MSHTVLTDPDYSVPTVPDAVGGIAWLRSCVARFSEGETHRRRRALVVAELAKIDPDSLRDKAGGHVATLAVALGLPHRVAGDIAVIARSYQPHTVITAEADRAVERLVAACGGVADEATANRIGLLVRACDAGSGSIAGQR